MQYCSCISTDEYTGRLLISEWIRLHCFNFIKGLMQFITSQFMTLKHSVMALMPAEGGWRTSRWGGVIPGSPHPNECIIRLWFPGLRQPARAQSITSLPFPKCLLPTWPCHFICCFLFAECMLSICYANSCYNSCATGLVFYKSWVRREWGRMHFNKTPVATH